MTLGDKRWEESDGRGSEVNDLFLFFLLIKQKKEENKVEGRVVEWEDASDTRRFWVQYH